MVIRIRRVIGETLIFLETYDCRVDVIREAADWQKEGGVRLMGYASEGRGGMALVYACGGGGSSVWLSQSWLLPMRGGFRCP